VLVGAVLFVELLCRTGVIVRFTMIPPSEMVVGLVQLLLSGKMNSAMATTLSSVAIALCAAVLVGTVVGAIIHALPRVRRTIDPLLATYYSVEIFGPVVSVLRWSHEDDLMRRVNALDYGLTGSIWTRDLDRAHRLAARVQSGYIWINDAATHYVGAPFGGYKQSGIGREESIDEILACTRIKNINVKYGAASSPRSF
jgi:hypothetical protein